MLDLTGRHPATQHLARFFAWKTSQSRSRRHHGAASGWLAR